MKTQLKRLIPTLLVASIGLVIFLGFVWPIVSIQLRLWRNGEIAARLVESLRARFPGVEFRGGPSYESEVIYISIRGGLRPEQFPEVEQRLRELKAERHIAPAIWLERPGDAFEEDHWLKL